MEERKPENFEIPSFVENKEPIDKSIFQLKEDVSVAAKEEYVPAHSENTAALRKRVAKEIEEVLETPQDSYEEFEEEEEPAQKTPLWIIILSVVAILTALVAVGLLVKDFLFSTPKSSPTPTPVVTVAPSATPTATVLPNASAAPTTTANPSETSATSPTATPTTTANTTNTTTPSTESSSTYVLQASMNVRSGPSVDNALVGNSNIPSAYRGSADGSVIREGTTVTILEIRSTGNAKWGRIGDNAWICLDDGQQVFAKKK